MHVQLRVNDSRCAFLRGGGGGGGAETLVVQFATGARRALDAREAGAALGSFLARYADVLGEPDAAEILYADLASSLLRLELEWYCFILFL